MDSMLEGIAGAINVMDDILIAAHTVEELDKILRQVAERATSYNLSVSAIRGASDYRSDLAKSD